jgi:hypothetical protein
MVPDGLIGFGVVLSLILFGFIAYVLIYGIIRIFKEFIGKLRKYKKR